ncbi:RNase HI [Desulforamulus reducens MI-1]|uniref:Ribonuclease H n=1 Tax=Desulforamulus reducens (strain ATCC BAA-1160 / DSM 100696 / MI-1) TaxID=349161 RepID=RNH_DESRM|nr:ribonuclease HI [Desulforamulus reducens]A4J7B3.1 RecName: Full=Ribonuclease H; Short=RNase H [Desulforamulus reducens MI-1]ABO50966.1 RNase HI [Desulforamulus reducens MI-1]
MNTNQNTNLKEITMYTDGACSGNPGPGGYGVVMLYKGHRKELSAGFRDTTNNRMELLATIVGLETLKEKCNVNLYTDSQYVVNAIEKGWAKKWRANGWMRNKKEPALNPDLWERLLKLCEFHNVKFNWVKGHAGHPENERCDQLAVAAAKQPNLPLDVR